MYINTYILNVPEARKDDYTRMEALGDMPFNGKHMILGGFEPLLAWRKGEG